MREKFLQVCRNCATVTCGTCGAEGRQGQSFKANDHMSCLYIDHNGDCDMREINGCECAACEAERIQDEKEARCKGFCPVCGMHNHA